MKNEWHNIKRILTISKVSNIYTSIYRQSKQKIFMEIIWKLKIMKTMSSVWLGLICLIKF